MKKVLSFILCAIMLSSVCFGATFTDMPDDWSKAPLENAVTNGLITGSDGLIRPTDYMTRAEMATIIVRAFGAQEEADISAFTDVPNDAWFYSSMAKAVALGAFNGDGDKLNPQNNITRQETFVVLGRMFGLNVDKLIDNYFKTGVPADEVLAQFEDGAEVASWAKELVAALINNKYVNGNNGRINPNAPISRAEFAAIMDKLVKTYIDEPGKYTFNSDGNILVRCEGVTIENSNITGNIIVAEGAKDGATINNTTVSNSFVVRTGENSIIANSACHSVRLITENIKTSISKVDRSITYVTKNSELIDNIDIDLGE